MTVERNGQYWREVGPWIPAKESLPSDIPQYLLVRDAAFMQHIQDDGQDSFNAGFDNGWREAIDHLTQMQIAGQIYPKVIQ